MIRELIGRRVAGIREDAVAPGVERRGVRECRYLFLTSDRACMLLPDQIYPRSGAPRVVMEA